MAAYAASFVKGPRPAPHARRATPRRRRRHRHHLQATRPLVHLHHRNLPGPPRAPSGHRNHAKSKLDGRVKARRALPTTMPRCCHAVSHVLFTASAPSASKSARSRAATTSPPMPQPWFRTTLNERPLLISTAWRAERWTLGGIADELNARAVPTKTGKSDRWTHHAVARILRRT